MYGHEFYNASVEKRVAYLNSQLEAENYDSLEELGDDHHIDIEDVREELSRFGYYFVADLNKFVCCSLEHTM